MDWLDIKEFFKDAIKYIVLIIIVLVVAIYIVGLQQVVGSSMSPTLENNDVAILNKIKYKIFKVQRYDIVSLNYSDTKYLIKRVIGLPGEYIEYKDNKLYVNNKIIDEKYLKNIITDDFKLEDLGYDKIPDNMYFVLGDNRKDSLDSRDSSLGLVKKEDIIGEVSLRIWPLNRINLF